MEINKEDFYKLRELEESLWRSETRFDQDYMNRIMAPDFGEFGRSGRIYQRAEILGMPYQKIDAKLPLENFNVRLIDTNVALVTCISQVQYDELQISNRSSIWSRTSAGWQIRFHQGTPVQL